MASLELRNQTYRVVFMFRGRKYGYSLDTGDRDTAEALRGGVEKTLKEAESHHQTSGRQEAAVLPERQAGNSSRAGLRASSCGDSGQGSRSFQADVSRLQVGVAARFPCAASQLH